MFSDPLTAAAANRTMKQALKPIRNQIAEAAPQLKPLANSGMPLVVALANPLSRPAPFEASMVIAAMYGEPAYTFPADGGAGRMTLGLNGKLTNDHPYISAVIALPPDVHGIELASRWFDQNRASFSTPEEMIAEYRRIERSGAFGSGNTVAIDLIETAGTAARLPENFANGPDDTCWSASSLRSLVQRRRPREGSDGRGGALGICAGKSDARQSAITDRLLGRREGRCLL